MDLVKRKKIDFYLQVFVLFLAIVYAVFDTYFTKKMEVELSFIWSYMIVAFLQIVSTLYYAYEKESYTIWLRSYFTITLFCIAVVVLVSLFIPKLFLSIILLLFFISPILAFLYCYICYKEWQFMKYNEVW